MTEPFAQVTEAWGAPRNDLKEARHIRIPWFRPDWIPGVVVMESGTVFISHSSLDKPFVYRLAVDLLTRGFSVWVDRWQIGGGDDLPDEINTNVDAAACVLLVVSKTSNESSWVQRELKRARQVERQRGHLMIIPVLLDGTELPSPVSKRVFIDFRKSYGEGLDGVVGVLRHRGLDRLPVDPERALIPLAFTRGVDLNAVAFERRVSALIARQPDRISFRDDQFIVAPEDEYTALRTRVIKRKDDLADDPFYSTEFQDDFLNRIETLEKYERILISGVRRITNTYGGSIRPRYADAAAWFARLVRAKTIGLLYTSQAPGHEGGDYGREWARGPTDSPDAAASFYGFRSAVPVQLVGPQPAIHSGTRVPWATIGMWIDGESRAAATIHEPFETFLFPEIDYESVATKQAIPSMVFAFESHPLEGELWDLNKCRVTVP